MEDIIFGLQSIQEDALISEPPREVVNTVMAINTILVVIINKYNELI